MSGQDDEKGFFHRRLTLGNAVILSLFLHLAFVVGSELSFPDFYTPPDEVLARKKPAVVQRVRITAATRPPAPPPGPRFISSASLTEPTAPKPATEKAQATPAIHANEDAAASALPGEDKSVAAAPAETDTGAPAPPPEEPAPAFPVEVHADLELRINGLSVVAEQHWVMEGYHYAITVSGKKFGFKAKLESEGLIGSDGGLQPSDFRMKLNGHLHSFAEYRSGMLRHGKTSATKTELLPVAPQDVASLPFHVAVTFNGAPQTIKVTTGKSLYEVRLVLDAEETLKLPVGTLRTLHLRGERFNPADGTLIAGYEVWLAPDYLNYPVKFIGRTGSGDVVEYRVKRLEIEGKNVLGDPADHVITPEGDDIPEWLKHRIHDTSGNTPEPEATP